MNELQHGDSVESWTIHTHEVRLICPKCRYMMHQTYRPSYTLDYPHVITCQCGQSFGVKWQDKMQDAKVTIHTYVDVDIDEETEIINARIICLGKAKPEV